MNNQLTFRGFIGNNARTILEVYEYCIEHNSDSVLMFLYFEKASDSIEWNFLSKTLKQFNFWDSFIKWINILYTKPIFRIKNNGWISNTCWMSREIRQWCPVSALFYIFVAEILIKTEIFHLSNANFTQQTLLKNEIFEYQENLINLKNKIDSNILYIKNMFNDNGEFKTLHDFLNVLVSKSK